MQIKIKYIALKGIIKYKIHMFYDFCLILETWELYFLYYHFLSLNQYQILVLGNKIDVNRTIFIFI